jgi:hypothetical protein
LRIETYFQELRQIIEACSVTQSYNVRFDKRGTYEGFIKGEVYLVDGSTLHVREFVDVEVAVEHLTYVYQYMSPTKHLIFRYDNTGHHRQLNRSTYPHHKHEGDENHVVTSSAPDLDAVLKEIEPLIRLPS